MNTPCPKCGGELSDWYTTKQKSKRREIKRRHCSNCGYIENAIRQEDQLPSDGERIRNGAD